MNTGVDVNHANLNLFSKKRYFIYTIGWWTVEWWALWELCVYKRKSSMFYYFLLRQSLSPGMWSTRCIYFFWWF